MSGFFHSFAHYLEKHYRMHPKRVMLIGCIILLHILLILGLLSNTSKEDVQPQSSHSSLAVTMIAPPPPEQATPQLQTPKQDYVAPTPNNEEPSPLEQISHEKAEKKPNTAPPKPQMQQPPLPVKPPTPVHSKNRSPVHSRKAVKTPPTKSMSQQQAQSAQMQPNGQAASGTGAGQGQGGTGAQDGPAGNSPINGAKLVYPPEMEAENVEGRVTAICDVLTSGATQNCVVKGASGGDAFARSAMDYLSRARFKPAISHGVPVIEKSKVYVIRYRLDE